MKTMKYLVIFFAVFACFMGNIQARDLSRNNKVLCKDKDSCINDFSCQCYCSVKCGPRDKTKDDRPVYVENDPNGHYCYCKQWDLDNYKTRKCDIKEQNEKSEKTEVSTFEVETKAVPLRRRIRRRQRVHVPTRRAYRDRVLLPKKMKASILIMKVVSL